MARTRKRALWVNRESTYGADASTNGSGYLWVPTMTLGDLKDAKEQLDTEYKTGRNFPTAPIAGRDGWSFDCEIPVIGLAARIIGAASPSAEDWFDDILIHIFGTQTAVASEEFNGSSTTSSWILATDARSVQQLIAAWENDIPSALAERTQWGYITVDGGTGTYTVVPTADAAPTTAAVAYGHWQYEPDDDGGPSLSFVYRQDDVDYTLLGGRCTKASIEFEAGKIVMMKLSFAGDTKTLDAGKSSLPVAGSAPAVTPLKGLLSPLYFGGTKYSVAKVSVDLGIKAAVLDSTQATNGRGGYENIEMHPMITVDPLFTDDITNLKRNCTQGRVLLQLGAGQDNGTALNTCCIAAEEGVVVEADPTDENGRIRSGVKIKITDKVYSSGSTVAKFFQFCRA